jgi:carbon-monoxide dehydrogenase small subunit
MCGACTILVNGRASPSCLLLAIDLAGARVETVESLGHGESLHPLQQAFVAKGALQCGYCTAGMLLSAKALLDETPRPSRDQIARALTGNLCRCTGYAKIFEAIEMAAEGSNT